ncbi:MAG: hypothetical protein A2X82_12175 [Geobacteraceae bacterium GWC2_55_20]|nr:MAG: hypothetical protein A2X82_12175 [Geobacteraceae bacterium GWC2_55_20]OGU26487.1 MAG: hypothetical protein A2X85_04735 [Geobacteraceae bacterium GWF2_54_21]HBA71506.1 hydrogenase [Geobacter sp.]HCE69393.1 hydrogenase [Geobacter sp.]
MSKPGKIDILTRVEGHGRVELVRKGRRIVDARLNLHESPRLFETLLIGRRFDEVAEIACRICSICSTVHKVAALRALEQALNVRISQQTDLLRQLAVQGGQIESHALHIFCLALPDYLGVGGFPALASVAPLELQQGLKIKALGNLIQETVGGRAIHPFNLLPGGLGSVPGVEQLQHLADQLSSILDNVSAMIGFVSTLDEGLPALPLLSACAVSGGPPLFGDRLATSTGVTVPATSAAVWLNERNEDHTHAKVSRFDGESVFMVGPLARLNLSKPTEYGKRLDATSITDSLKARTIELHQAVERAMSLISQLLNEGLRKETPTTITPSAGEGTALIEAPRGVLLHNYRFDELGICRAANIITPTAINQAAIEMSLKSLISVINDDGYESIKLSCERLIRCFDPCISCAVH